MEWIVVDLVDRLLFFVWPFSTLRIIGSGLRGFGVLYTVLIQGILVPSLVPRY